MVEYGRELPPPPAVPALPGRPLGAALALALALTLGAGEAAAQQPWCEGTAVTGRTEIIVCDRGAGDPNPANVHIIARNPDITATLRNEDPIVSDVHTDTDVTIEVTGGSLRAAGDWAKGIRVWHPGASGDIVITLKDVDLRTEGLQGGAVYVFQQGGAGAIRIDMSGGSITTTGPTTSQGILGLSTGSGDIDIDVRDVVIKTAADNGLAIYGVRTGATGNVDVAVRGGSIETTGFLAHGVMAATVGGAGNVDVSVADAFIVTRERFTRAIAGATSGQGDITVDVSGAAVATAEGEGSVGVYAVHSGDGSSETTIGAGTRIRAPFANGVHGRMTATANAAGRVVITSGGAIEARDAGILAWVEPRSGHTHGAGMVEVNDAARTQPMIHVTSSGDITVGEGVMDAWIRAAAAGDDETLSAGEQAVLEAIVAGDSSALETALATLPAAYTDGWRTRVRAFQSARGAMRTDRHGASGRAPTTAAREAEAAAVEILDIPRAGIRAMALSHVEIADHIRVGDVDPAITAIAEASRTAQQRATLATQQMLSAAERAVLRAVLTGGDPETALAGLPAAYTNAWKDGVRQRALSYNGGEIRVDVTGGTIVSEGDGVYARHVLNHDRNGAITVTVAEGAVVSGERNGIYVGGASLAAGSASLGGQTVTGGAGAGVHLADGGAILATGSASLRPQTVTVNGVVTGGTGAGVRLAGGGTVVVGCNGRIGASSGVGIFSDGADDLVVVIADPDELGDAAPRIEGRIEMTGGGAPRVLLQRSGAAGTVELLAGGAPVPSGAWDVSVEEAGSGGGLAFVREFGPRARVYEALPSMLLGMNGLARFRERMSAPRTDSGAWARVETSFGSWKAETSTTGGLEYSHRRYGLRAGRDVPVGEESLLGVSLHHRRGSADVRRGGEIDLSGSGAGVSWAWSRDGAYVDAQTEVTWYEAGFRSSSRGTLKEDVSGRGHALGLEVGRRMSMPANWGSGWEFTPRAGVEHSKVSLDDFTDAVGARVSMEEARSLKGRVGLVAEAVTDGSPHRLSGSLDVEHEFEDDAKVRMTGADLKPEGEPTWVRVGLAGSRVWGDDGRYTLSGGVSYARGGDSSELTGGASWKMRF